MQSIAFPMRLQENGLLQRDEASGAILSLLQMMARTPRGSWRACASFGLRDLFEDGRQRADLPRLAAERINDALHDLGIEGYVVTEVVRELSPNRDTDTYSITLENATAAEIIRTRLVHEQ